MLPVAGFFSAALIFGALFVANSVQVASLITLPFSRSLFRRINRECARAWWGLSVFWTEKVYGIRIVFTGDEIPNLENAIVIANHQEMPDVVAVFAFALRKKRLGDLKWYSKDAIKYIPGVGWGLLFLDCLFLKRDWDRDASKIRALFARFLRDRIPVWMVSFPEGTRIKPAKLKKSQEFAKQAGLPVLQHVLLPRPRGFIASVIGLEGCAEAVYDMTIGYPNGIPSLWQLFSTPVREIHIHVQRFPVKSLPQGDQALTQWLYDRFVEKDQRMDRFFRDKKFT